MKRIIFVSLLTAGWWFTTGAAAQNDARYLAQRPQPLQVESSAGTPPIPVVFYRLGGQPGRVPTVKVDGMVVGSLLPDTYAQTGACSHRFEAGVATRGEQTGPTVGMTTDDTHAGAVYIKVIDRPDAKFALQQMDPATAQEESKGLRLLSRVIDRHTPKCAAR